MVSKTSLLDGLTNALCIRHGIDTTSTFDGFLQSYNEKYLFVDEHPKWYTDKFMYTIPVKDVLRRTARQQQLDITDRVLTEEILWTSMRHIKTVCKELYCLGLPLDKYLALVDGNYPNSTPSDLITESCRREIIKRGSLPRREGTESSDYITAYECIEYGQWHLLGGVNAFSIDTVRTILTSCERFDLLERRGDLIVVNDPHEGSNLSGTELNVADISSIYFGGKVTDLRHLERLGLDMHAIRIDESIWDDIRNLESFKLVGTRSNIDQYKYVCEIETKEDLEMLSMECCSASVVLRNVEYLMKTIPGIGDEFLIDTFQMMLDNHDNCYDPYEVRMMVKKYPQVLTDSTREQIKNIVDGDGPMKRWFDSL